MWIHWNYKFVKQKKQLMKTTFFYKILVTSLISVISMTSIHLQAQNKIGISRGYPWLTYCDDQGDISLNINYQHSFRNLYNIGITARYAESHEKSEKYSHLNIYKLSVHTYINYELTIYKNLYFAPQIEIGYSWLSYEQWHPLQERFVPTSGLSFGTQGSLILLVRHVGFSFGVLATSSFCNMNPNKYWNFNTNQPEIKFLTYIEPFIEISYVW